jgi:hypothetical protein
LVEFLLCWDENLQATVIFGDIRKIDFRLVDDRRKGVSRVSHMGHYVPITTRNIKFLTCNHRFLCTIPSEHIPRPFKSYHPCTVSRYEHRVLPRYPTFIPDIHNISIRHCRLADPARTSPYKQDLMGSNPAVASSFREGNREGETTWERAGQGVEV